MAEVVDFVGKPKPPDPVRNWARLTITINDDVIMEIPVNLDADADALVPIEISHIEAARKILLLGMIALEQ
jgi:hypothetical protein